MRTKTISASQWQEEFLALLPQIERRIEFRLRLRNLRGDERDEARQAVIVLAMLTYRRLAQRGRTARAFVGPLVEYGFRQHAAGRLAGGSMNSGDVGSLRWRRVIGRRVESLNELSETVAPADQRNATPAEIAALRIDFAAWLQTLSARSRRAVGHLVQGESTQAVARLLGVSAGRVSQLRRELRESWQRFRGGAAPATSLAGSLGA